MVGEPERERTLRVRQSHKTFLLWILLILLFFVVWQFLSQARNEERRLSFSQFVQDVEQHPERFKATAPIQIRKNQDSAEFKGTYATGGLCDHGSRRRQ